jgi:WhiB family redox-sensing transcriptional regulator
MEDDQWRKYASCNGLPVSLFFEGYESSNAIQLEVDSLCSQCVVRKQCLEYAIENNIEGGVFGRTFFPSKNTAKGKIASGNHQ